MRLFKIATLGTAYLSAQVLAAIAATASEAAEAMTIVRMIGIVPVIASGKGMDGRESVC